MVQRFRSVALVTAFYLGACALSVGALTLVLATPAQAAEVSIMQGVFKTELDKSGSSDMGKVNTLGGGARYSDQIEGHLFWFGEGHLIVRSYEKGDAPVAPSDSTSLSAAGGVRWYFNKLSENISPFAYGYGKFGDDKTGNIGTGQDTETNGLYYGAAFGIRISLQKEFFVDIEGPLFESALFATTKTTSRTTSVDPATNKTTTVTSTNEVKKTELWADSTGQLNNIEIALGMRF